MCIMILGSWAELFTLSIFSEADIFCFLFYFYPSIVLFAKINLSVGLKIDCFLPKLLCRNSLFLKTRRSVYYKLSIVFSIKFQFIHLIIFKSLVWYQKENHVCSYAKNILLLKAGNIKRYVLKTEFIFSFNLKHSFNTALLFHGLFPLKFFKIDQTFRL